MTKAVPDEPVRREKFEFHVGRTKVTARNRECRIVSAVDFTDVPRERLERAVKAFEAALAPEGKPSIRKL